MKYIIMMAILIFAISCQKEEIQEQKEFSETPPSMKEDQGDIDFKTIVLDEKQLNELDIKTTEITNENYNSKIRVRGLMVSDPQNTSIVSSTISAIVKNINKVEGDYVNKGDIILELEGRDIAEEIYEYVSAKNEFVLAENNLKRNEKLAENNINSKKDFQSIQTAFQIAKSNLATHKTILLNIGFSKSDIEEIESDRIPQTLKVKANISGVINDLFVKKGEAVNTYDELVSIIDERGKLALAYVPTDMATFINKGDKATLYSGSNTNKSVLAEIIKFKPSLNEETRTLVAILKPDAENSIKIGENLNIEISTEMAAQGAVIPSNSIEVFGEKKVIFIQNSDYEYQAVEVNVIDQNDKYALIENLDLVGQKVVTNQLFTLKSLIKYEEFAE